MNFDVIIGNPPYQEMTGGGTTTLDSSPLYNKFIEKSIGLNPRYISMIIPSRWTTGGKKELDAFRKRMVEDRHLLSMVHYSRAYDIFDGLGIAGGILYLLWDKGFSGNTNIVYNNSGEITEAKRDISKYSYEDSHGNQQYMIILDNTAVSIIEKIATIESSGEYLDNIVLNRRPFGIDSNFEDSLLETSEKQIRVAKAFGKETWTDREHILKNQQLIGKWKVCCGKTAAEGGWERTKTSYNVTSKPFVLKPNEICSETYLVLDTFNSKEEALNMITYMKTKLVRFLILITLSGINITSRNYMFIPLQNYNKQWTDKELYNKYSLTDKEIDYIEHRIAIME